MIRQIGLFDTTTDVIVIVSQYKDYVLTGNCATPFILTVEKYYASGLLQSSFTVNINTTETLIDQETADNQIAYIKLLNIPGIAVLNYTLDGGL